jgi:hypothetical protein
MNRPLFQSFRFSSRKFSGRIEISAVAHCIFNRRFKKSSQINPPENSTKKTLAKHVEMSGHRLHARKSKTVTQFKPGCFFLWIEKFAVKLLFWQRNDD